MSSLIDSVGTIRFCNPPFLIWNGILRLHQRNGIQHTTQCSSCIGIAILVSGQFMFLEFSATLCILFSLLFTVTGVNNFLRSPYIPYGNWVISDPIIFYYPSELFLRNVIFFRFSRTASVAFRTSRFLKIFLLSNTVLKNKNASFSLDMCMLPVSK